MFRCFRLPLPTRKRHQIRAWLRTLQAQATNLQNIRRFHLQIMTESQPEGSETTSDAMEEDLIEESAFEVEESDQYTPGGTPI